MLSNARFVPKWTTLFLLATTALSQASTASFRIFDKDEQDKHIILSIDGGGTRGLIPARLLQRLSHDLSAYVTRNTPVIEGLPLAPEADACLAGLVDVVGGTSTGSIIAAALSTPHSSSPYLSKFTPNEIVDFYKREAAVIFPSNSPWKRLFQGTGGFGIFKPKYDSRPLESLLQQNFGEAQLKDVFIPLMVTAYNLDTARLDVLDSFEAQDTQRGPYHNFYIRDTVRSSAAAPTYLKSSVVYNMHKDELHFADGGLVSNNPALAIYSRYRSLYPQVKDITIISLGCGVGDEDKLANLGNGGKIHWAQDVANLMITGAMLQVDQTLYNLEKAGAVRYLRLQPTLTTDLAATDNSLPEHLRRLKARADSLLSDEFKRYEDIQKVFEVELQRRRYYTMARMLADLERKFPQFHQETTLDTSGFFMGNRGMWELSRFLLEKTTIQGLKKLNLTNNNLNDQSVSIFLAYPNLTDLILDNNRFSPKALETLAQHPSLQKVSLQHNNMVITASSLNSPSLKQALPRPLTIDLRHNKIDNKTAFLTELVTTEIRGRFVFEWDVQEAWYQKLGATILTPERLETQAQILKPFLEEGATGARANYLSARLYSKEKHIFTNLTDQERFIQAFTLYQRASEGHEMAAHYALADIYNAARLPSVQDETQRYMQDYRQKYPGKTDQQYEQDERIWQLRKAVTYYTKSIQNKDWIEMITEYRMEGPVQAHLQIGNLYERHCGDKANRGFPNFFGISRDEALKEALRHYQDAYEVYHSQKRKWPSIYQAYENAVLTKGIEADIEHIHKLIMSVKSKLDIK